jgi:hypothetical protein
MPRTTNTCRNCRYSLAGLSRQGTCPECGLYYDADYDYPGPIRDRIYSFPRRLARELHDASPWLAERYLPSIATTTKVISVLGYSAILCTIGAVIIGTLSSDLSLFRRRPAPPPTGPGLFNDMLAATIQWAPLFLAVYFIITAWQGMFRHRIRITDSAVVTGTQARTFGLVAFAAALALAGLFTWLRIIG